MSIRDVALSVLVCRGCCCGQQEGPDHSAHLAQIGAAVDHAGGRLKVTNCIGPCDRKNVVVVRTRTASRWTARYYAAVDDDHVAALQSWFAAGPVTEPEPAALAAARFDWPIPRPRLPRSTTATIGRHGMNDAQ